MGCDGIWEKKSNEEMVDWVYQEFEKSKKDKIDLKEIVSNLLLDTIAEDVASSGGVGCDNMTCILIKFDMKSS